LTRPNNLVGINILGQTSAPGSIDGVRIVDNWFGANMLERIQIVGIQGLAGVSETAGTSSQPQVHDVTIARNTFTTCPDPCVLAYSALALAGAVFNASVEGLVIEDNDMAVDGGGVILIGGYTLAAGRTDNSTLTAVVVRNNTIRPRTRANAGQCLGIGIYGDWTDFHAGAAITGSVNRVVIDGNDVTGCDRGLVVAGTFAAEEVSGAVQSSSVNDVTIVGNHLISNSVGPQIAGALLRYGRVFANSPSSIGAGGAGLVGNSVVNVSIHGNMLRANQTGLLVTGASIYDTNGHVVRGNLAKRILVGKNSNSLNQRDCRQVAEFSDHSQNVMLDNAVIESRVCG
jgi:hypothetical protein